MSTCDAIKPVPIFQNYLGLVDGNLEFDYANGVWIGDGCALAFRGQMWYFGGSGNIYGNYRRQVSSKAILQIYIIHS